MRHIYYEQKLKMYSHWIEVVDVFYDYFSEEVLLVHDGRVTWTYEFCLHGFHFVYLFRVGLSSPWFLV